MQDRHAFVVHRQISLAQGEIVEKQAALGRSALTIMIVDCTLWPGRAISVDESLALVQAICGGNSSTLGFVLMPQPHSSATHTAILAHRRAIENTCIASFDLQEISLVYNESTHGGDRRKTNQQCLAITSGNHKHIEWTKSKIMLGSITGVDRSRVNELQNPEEDRPLAPHWRVQQRGIDASKAILKKLLEGLQLPENAPILVVDCLPNRFGEWSQACAQLQLAYVLGQDKSVSWNYMGIVLGDDAGIMHSLSSKTAGQFMANWWDVSQEAGPKRRSRTPFSEPVPTMEILAVANGQCKIPDLVRNKYVATQSAAVTKIEDAIARNKNLKVALQGTLDESASTLPSSSGDVPADSGSRTLASPDYSGAIDVPNFSTRVHLEEKPMDEFTAGRTIQCQAQLQNSDLNVARDKNDGSLWLTNSGDSAAELQAREILGFNLGSFAELTSGDAATVADAIPWLITSDLQVVCLVSVDTNGFSTKELMTVADVCCWITKTRGVTEAAMLDHDMAPLTEETPHGRTPKTFRYSVTPRAKVNCFKPKKLEGDPATSRYSQFGAIYSDFKQLTSSSSLGIVWEVKVADGVPAVITPLKPKYFLKGVTTVAAKTAVKL
ncbi:unnamed protein product [Durusdinium trenchii]|uniref:Uncharacterized protein n=1 Tax=Durusdinium trenchii TaxID=1381693 RepID=A0ABP0SFT6_9DINO